MTTQELARSSTDRLASYLGKTLAAAYSPTTDADTRRIAEDAAKQAARELVVERGECDVVEAVFNEAQWFAGR